MIISNVVAEFLCWLDKLNITLSSLRDISSWVRSAFLVQSIAFYSWVCITSRQREKRPCLQLPTSCLVILPWLDNRLDSFQALLWGRNWLLETEHVWKTDSWAAKHAMSTSTLFPQSTRLCQHSFPSKTFLLLLFFWRWHNSTGLPGSETQLGTICRKQPRSWTMGRS